jgi:hypothetical protein
VNTIKKKAADFLPSEGMLASEEEFWSVELIRPVQLVSLLAYINLAIKWNTV